MSYVDDVTELIAREIGASDDSDDSGVADWSLHRLYALLAMVKGTAVTASDVHDAWAVWRAETTPDDPDIMPFDRLSEDAQAKDAPFQRAIERVARRLSQNTHGLSR